MLGRTIVAGVMALIAVLAVLAAVFLVGMNRIARMDSDASSSPPAPATARAALGLLAPDPMAAHPEPPATEDEQDAQAMPGAIDSEVHAHADEYSFESSLRFTAAETGIPSIDPDIIATRAVPARLDELMLRHTAAQLRERPPGALIGRRNWPSSGILRVQEAARRLAQPGELALHALVSFPDPGRTRQLSGNQIDAMRRSPGSGPR